MGRIRLPAIKMFVIAGVVVLLFGLLSLFHPFRRNVRIGVETAMARLHTSPQAAFPQLQTSGLISLQQKIIALSSQEYARKPVSFDKTVRKYTQGQSEAWCADYVSWIFQEAGRPLKNPNSGSWRIPGVFTLKEYYQSQHRYKAAGAYVPRVGDVAIYLRGGGEGHTNIVLEVKNGKMTTVGGNEAGHLRLNTQSYTPGTEGLDGFGLFSSPIAL